MKLGAPRLLTSVVNLSSGHVGSKPFDIQTPNHEALLVSELRVHAFNVLGRNTRGISKFGNYTDVGGFIYIKVRLGPYAFSSQAIPVWTLAASRDFTQEGADWRMPLAKPMFVPPGMSLFAEVSRPGIDWGAGVFEPQPIRLGSFDTALTVVARVVTGDFPRTTSVPYVSTYVEADPVGGRGFRSGQQTLDNQLKRSIELRYALGRVAGLEVGAIPALGHNEAHELTDVHLSMPCSMLYGNQVIINPGSEFNVAFDPCTRVLNLGGQVLPAGDRLTFKADAPTYTLNPDIDAFMVVLGIIGDRKEAV